MGAVFGLVFLAYAFAFLLLVAQYVTGAIALLRIAKRLGIPRGWMAFIPVADAYLLGQIANVNTPKKNHVKRLVISACGNAAALVIYFVLMFLYAFAMEWLDPDNPIWLVLTLALFGLALLCLAAVVLYLVFYYMAIWRVCENFGGEWKLGYFLGCILGTQFCSGLVQSILLLILSCKTPAVSPVPTASAESPAERTSNDDVF